MAPILTETERNTLEAVAVELAETLSKLNRWRINPTREAAKGIGYGTLHTSGGRAAVDQGLQREIDHALMASRYIGLIA